MKILLLENYPEIKIEYLKYLEKNNKIFNLLDDFKNSEIEILIIRSKIFIDEKILEKYKNIKYICRIWVWLEKIDLKLCEKKWIKVLNTPNANSDSVADLVLAWILNLSRNLNKISHINHSPEERGAFLNDRFDFMWNEIWWKTVWIIWFWNVWKKVYERLKAFWVKNFLIYDPFLEKNLIEKNIFCKKIETKEEIFLESEILSFHIPLLNSTKNFLWEKNFLNLKKNILIINSSRWWIIEEKFLIKFLKENSEAKFFWDVWEEENFWWNPKKELLEMKNVLITPHIWAMTKEAEKKMHYFEEIENLKK